MKTCPTCKLSQPPENFHRNAAKRDGRNTNCMACRRAYEKKNPEKQKEHSSKYYNLHRPEILQKKHLFRVEHPEKTKAVNNRHRVKNPQRWWAKNVMKRHAARKRPCLFTLEQLLDLVPKDNICPSCGNIFKWNNSNKHNPDSPSLDQINRALPLWLSNARVVCRQCNTAKSTYTEAEFRDWVERIATRQRDRDATVIK